MTQCAGAWKPQAHGSGIDLNDTDSLTIWSGSLRRMQQVLRTKGRRDRVCTIFQLPDHQDQEGSAGAYRGKPD